MTIFINRALQTYAPGTYAITRTIPANAVVNRVRIAMTDAGDWPASGDVAKVTLIFPDGAKASVTLGGGVLKDKQGNTLTVRSAEFSQSREGQPVPFDTGDYTLSFEVLQTVSSAVTVERF